MSSIFAKLFSGFSVHIYIYIYIYIFVFFEGGEGTPLKVAGGRPRRLRDDFVPIFDGFWPPFGEPRGSLWGSFGRQSLKMERLCRFFGAFFGASKKGAKKLATVVKKEPFLEAVDMAQV